MKLKRLIAASAAAAMMASNSAIITGASFAAETAAESKVTYGDANLDGDVSLGDALAILQFIANKEKYPMDEQAQLNADCVDPGSGITGLDAIAVQLIDVQYISRDDLPLTSEKLESFFKKPSDSDTPEEQGNATVSDGIYAFGVYNEETKSVDIEWLVNEDVKTVELFVSDDNKKYVSAAKVEDSDSYSYALEDINGTVYFKVGYTDDKGNSYESFPFFITKEEDTYITDFFDADEDGIADMFESAYGSDIDSKDTDMDGLTDYEEVYITGTDPAVSDSHKKGVSDAEADCDDDGIPNKKEMELGTNPLDKDTDGDGLTDGEEVNDLKTDPLVKDTDEDGLSDYAEHKMGTDPVNPKSVGNKDGDVFISQAVRVDAPVLDLVNTKENAYKLAVDMNVVGFAEEKLTVSKSRYTDVIDEEAIVGDVIDVVVDKDAKLDSMKLRFNIKDEYKDNTLGTYEGLEGIKRFSVFQYNEDIHMFIPLDTYYSESENSVIAYIDGTGTYCIMDSEIWFDSLGIKPEEEEDIPEKSEETGTVESPAMNGATDVSIEAQDESSAPTVRNEAFDLAFAIQMSGYDGDENFESQKKLIHDMSAYIFKNYDDVVIHLIPYDIQSSAMQLKENSTTNDFYDLKSLDAALDKLEYHAMWGPANRSLAYYQLYNELKYTYRFVDKRFVINLMNAGTMMLDPSQNGVTDVDYIYSLFWENNIDFSEVYFKKQPDSSLSYYMENEYGGLDIEFDPDTNYKAILEHIENNVEKYASYDIETINGNIKVVLKGALGPNSDNDTDGDGVLDWEELDRTYMIIYPDGTYEFPTYTELFEKADITVGKKKDENDVPYGPYQWHDTPYGPKLKDFYDNTDVAVWASNPLKEDSDNDGIRDVCDNSPFEALDDHFQVVDDYTAVKYRDLLSNGYEKVIHDSETSYLTKPMTAKMFADKAKLRIMAVGGKTKLSSLLNGTGFVEDIPSFVDVAGSTPNASKALSHFLNGKGTDMCFDDFNYAIGLTTVGRSRYYDNMNSFMDMVEKNVKLNHKFDFSTVKDIEKPRDVHKTGTLLASSWKCNYHELVCSYDLNASIDWWLAVGGGQNALAATVDCSKNAAGETVYTAKIKYYLLDYYDWSNDGEAAASDLHSSGLARSFLSYGCYETELEWKKGSRYPGDQWGNSSLCADTKLDGITDSALEGSHLAASIYYNVVTKA